MAPGFFDTFGNGAKISLNEVNGLVWEENFGIVFDIKGFFHYFHATGRMTSLS